MAPHRVASISRRSPLIALRYEETVQAEPPIPLPQRNPSRLLRPRSNRSLATVATNATTVTTTTTATTPTSSDPSTVPSLRSKTSQSSLKSSPTATPESSPTSSLASSSCSSPIAATAPAPLVILRPPMVAPPQEQHPALRKRMIRPIAEEGVANESCYRPKHDSFLAASSTSTLRANYCRGEMELAEELEWTPSKTYPSSRTYSAAVPPRRATSARQAAATQARTLSVASTGSAITTATMVINAAACDTFAEKAETAAATTAKRPSEDDRTSWQPAAPAPARERSWRLSRAFGFRTHGSTKSSGSNTSSSTTASHTNKKRRSGFVGLFGISARSDSNPATCSGAGDGPAVVLPPSTAPPRSAAGNKHGSTDRTGKLTKPRTAWSQSLAPLSSSSACENASKKPTPPEPDCTRTSRPSSPCAPPCRASCSDDRPWQSPFLSLLSSSSPPSSPGLPPRTPSSLSSPPPTSFLFRALSMSEPRRTQQSSSGAEGHCTRPSDDLPHHPATAPSTAPSTAPAIAAPPSSFAPLNTSIPSETLIEDDVLASMSFSHRGSLMLMGRRARGHAAVQPVVQPVVQPPAIKVEAVPPALEDETELESRKVRSMYDDNETLQWEQGQPPAGSRPDALEEKHTVALPLRTASIQSTSAADRRRLRLGDPIDDNNDSKRASVLSAATTVSTAPSMTEAASLQPSPWSVSSGETRNVRDGKQSTGGDTGPRPRGEFELAGGLEDWEDVDVDDVDRFGFIQRRAPGTSGREIHSSHSANGPRGLMPSGATMATQRSVATTVTEAARQSMRAAANRLPHNRDRRWVDEAGDMLTQSPAGLADIAEDAQAERLAELLKRKEWARSEKWRRMARVVHREGGGGHEGGGTDYVFDRHHPKLMERTWKGIPDCWRAAAWYSFLASSAEAAAARARARAREHKDGGETVRSETDAAIDDDVALIGAFHRLQQTGSPDDMQIDLDVPRTIGGHVLFRRRYRGGQRLLFRVLHALSLFCAPGTGGYVQGMASLAATLLCYYDEERCFVMLVRLFRLRGLERLYAPGFGGLVAALGEFEQNWLARNSQHAADKLAALGVDTMAYATRWYLTLFNLSVPFAAQLRIWDVFMLLGDSDGESADEGDLTILHATGAALVDALQDVLADADFENAMKALTSWIPVRDEDLLMRVVFAEWKRRQR